MLGPGWFDSSECQELIAMLNGAKANRNLNGATKQSFKTVCASAAAELVRGLLEREGVLRRLHSLLGGHAVLFHAELPLPTTRGDHHRDHDRGPGNLYKVIIATGPGGVRTSFAPSWTPSVVDLILFDAYRPVSGGSTCNSSH